MRCCFTGHRTFSPAVATELIARLEPVLERLYAAGVRDFRTGGALGFDTLAALRVIALRDRHPDCTLSLILPCRDQANRWCAPRRIMKPFCLKPIRRNVCTRATARWWTEATIAWHISLKTAAARFIPALMR